jgi:hypothetical protein
VAERLNATALKAVRPGNGSRGFESHPLRFCSRIKVNASAQAARGGRIAADRPAPSSGALFDCLSGQQDRNPGNVLWHEERSRIHLIDHGFAFARPGDRTGHLELTAWRWHHGSHDLDAAELSAVSDLTENDFGDLRGYLAKDRVDALLSRAQRLLHGRTILPPGEL